jgi:hypothetical protein
MEILIVLGALAGSYFLGMNIYLAKKNNELTKELKLQVETNYFGDDEDRENFIKFISDSREWAFDYIEEVQQKLSYFIDDIEPEIAYFDEYGLVGDAYPHYHSMKKISSAYKELKKLLPEESNA